MISREITQLQSGVLALDYLGPSPLLACNVSLAFNIFTSLASLQHVRHDEFFETTHYSKRDMATPSTLQQLAGLVRPNGNNSLEMHNIVSQGNKAYMPKATINMASTINMA